MNDFPLILSYTGPDGKPVRVRVNNSSEAEDAFPRMFRDCGRDVPYSVDSFPDAVEMKETS